MREPEYGLVILREYVRWPLYLVAIGWVIMVLGIGTLGGRFGNVISHYYSCMMRRCDCEMSGRREKLEVKLERRS